jgi:PAS domain S-box-containing protein
MQLHNISVQISPQSIIKAFSFLVFGLLCTFLVVKRTQNEVENQAKSEYVFACNEIKTKIDTRLHVHAFLLRTGAALFAASDTVIRKEWKNFYKNSKINKNLPGIQGLGFALLIPKNRLQQHLNQIRNEGFPKYSISPAGEREIFTSIIYLEPFFGRNLRAFGYDMFTEPIRRQAMEHARDLDIASLSGKVTLEQETNKDIQAGALMYVPVYKNGMSTNTIEERRKAIKGWVFSPYRMNDLMQGVLGQWNHSKIRRIHLQIYDDKSLSTETLLFDSQQDDKKVNDNYSTRIYTSSIYFNGKTWFLLFRQSTRNLPFFNNKANIMLIGGITISVLLFILVISFLNTKERAKYIAESLTRDITLLNEELERRVKERTDELHLVNKTLKQSELQLKILLNTIPDMVWLKDTQGVYLFCNHKVEKLFGTTEQNIIGKTDYDFLPKEKAEKYRIYDESVILEQKTKMNEDWVVYASNGYTALNETIEVPTYDLNGNLIGILGIARDITKRKAIEKALSESEMQLSAIFDNTNDFIWSLEADTLQVIRFNKAIKEFFSRKGIEIKKGKKIDELFEGELLNQWKWFVNRAILEGPFEIIYNIKEENKTLKNSYNQLIKDGKVYGISIHTTDISKLVQSEKELLERNQFIESVINLTPDILYIYDLVEQRNVFSNGGFEKTLGLTIWEISKIGNQFIPLLMHPDDILFYLEKVIPNYQKASEGEQIIRQYRMKDKNKNWRWIESSEIIYKRLPDGMPQQILGYAKDITERKLFEQQIINSVIETEERERQYFSQELHDGIGPLISASKIYVQWLLRPTVNIEKEEVLKDIEKLLDEAMQTVREISFKLSPHILMNYGLVEAITLFANKVNSSAQVDITISTENIARFNDKAEIIAYRALCECINNTIKHANASKINIEMHVLNEILYITYVDNGKGFNVDEVMSSKKGIGLLNIQSRLQSINGTFDINSSLGIGTKIKFQLNMQKFANFNKK